MRPAEVMPALLASCGSVKWEINRKCAPIVPPVIQYVEAMASFAGGPATATGDEEMLGNAAWLLFDHLFFFSMQEEN